MYCSYSSYHVSVLVSLGFFTCPPVVSPPPPGHPLGASAKSLLCRMSCGVQCATSLSRRTRCRTKIYQVKEYVIQFCSGTSRPNHSVEFLGLSAAIRGSSSCCCSYLCGRFVCLALSVCLASDTKRGLLFIVVGVASSYCL